MRRARGRRLCFDFAIGGIDEAAVGGVGESGDSSSMVWEGFSGFWAEEKKRKELAQRYRESRGHKEGSAET